MFQTILQALVPVVFVAGLGWLVGRLGVLDPQRIRSITTFIVTVALPAALFVGVFSFSPSQLENGRYLLTLAVALMGTWAVGFGLARIVFRSTTPSAGMLALNSSFPDLAFFGLPVLTAVIGAQGLLPIIVGNLVISVLMVPITIVLLGEMDGTKHESLFENLKINSNEAVSMGAGLRRHSCALRSEIAAARKGIGRLDWRNGWWHSALCSGRYAEWLDSAS